MYQTQNNNENSRKTKYQVNELMYKAFALQLLGPWFDGNNFNGNKIKKGRIQ